MFAARSVSYKVVCEHYATEQLGPRKRHSRAGQRGEYAITGGDSVERVVSDADELVVERLTGVIGYRDSLSPSDTEEGTS